MLSTLLMAQHIMTIQQLDVSASTLTYAVMLLTHAGDDGPSFAADVNRGPGSQVVSTPDEPAHQIQHGVAVLIVVCHLM
jgi:hypothetical protein